MRKQIEKIHIERFERDENKNNFIVTDYQGNSMLKETMGDFIKKLIKLDTKIKPKEDWK